MPYIEIETNYCKGCGLCIGVCAKQLLDLAEDIGANGFRTAVITDNEACTGCCYCALICPEAAIEVLMTVKEAANG